MTIAVGAYLVTYDFNLSYTVNHLTRFARSLCQTVHEDTNPRYHALLSAFELD